MPVSIALLRALNVGAANRIKMDQLRAVCAAAGYPDAVTFIQSGNVLFRTDDDPATVRARLERQLETDLGLRLLVVVRTEAELARIATAHPFADRTDDLTKLHVVFLAERISAADHAWMSARAVAPEEWVAQGSEVYVYYPAGAGTSKLKIKPAGTARNWNVVLKLLELARGEG
jgi:uncharacterized protein (DUF1697 family)